MGSQYGYLTLVERRLIFRLWEAKACIRQIAERLGRHRSTIYREVQRNWYDDAEAPRMSGYFPTVAHDAISLSTRANSLWVKAETVRWGKRGARVNTISPGIIMTPLANDELSGPRGEGYRRMIDLSPAGRAGTPDEVGTVAALLMSADGAFITGSAFLMDGGVTSSFFYGALAPR
jgi:hypothetical protein